MPMSRPRRIWVVVGCVLALAVGLELAARFAGSGRSRVKITNSGMTPIQNLVVSYGGTKVHVGTLAPGETGFAYLSGWAKGTLELAFTQAGNPMSGFLVEDFDPGAFGRDDLEQVLEIKADQVTKYLDDAAAVSPLSRLIEKIRNWIESELGASRL